MKEFFADFLELLTNCVLVLCLAFASFLLIINFYHYKEVNNLQQVDMTSTSYSDYKNSLAKVDKKMKSVKLVGAGYDTTAKPIYQYYSACKKALDDGTFAKLGNKNGISGKDVYDSNKEILDDYNGKCIFYIPYNITVIAKNNQSVGSFNSVFKKTEEKRNIVIDNADYLVKSGLGNSSYSFATDTARGTIYNKTSNELRLTMDNYKLMVSILDDVANWYVQEFGGNN